MSKEIWEYREKESDLQTGSKLDFTAHGIMESLSEFGACAISIRI